MRVKLKTKFGQFWDRKLRWGITAGEVKDLPEPLPQDTLTYQKLRMGGFEIVKDDADVIPSKEGIHADGSPIKSGMTEPDVPVGLAVPDDSEPDVIPSKEGIQVDDAPIESATTEPAAADRPTNTDPVDGPKKPAPKKRGRPKKTK